MLWITIAGIPKDMSDSVVEILHGDMVKNTIFMLNKEFTDLRIHEKDVNVMFLESRSFGVVQQRFNLKVEVQLVDSLIPGVDKSNFFDQILLAITVSLKQVVRSRVASFDFFARSETVSYNTHCYSVG